jgi:rhodanese-related sulfurtransferase
MCGLCLAVLALGGCQRRASVEQVKVTRITVDEVRARMDRGETIIFVDSRSTTSWEAGVAKIPGAVRVPPDEIGEHISRVPKGNPVVVYCT